MSKCIHCNTELVKVDKKVKIVVQLGEPTFDPTHISICPHCNCMTHTLYKGNLCGKCKGKK